MDFFIYIVLFFFLSFIIFFWYIKCIEKNIKMIEKNIQKSLRLRSDLIPSLYEISKEDLVKHKEIFKEILHLRKIQFSLNQYDVSFVEFVKNEVAINHEIRFIYNICNKNEKISNSTKFMYIKKLIIEKNKIIWKNMEKYKKYINKYNSTLIFKNLTFFWIFYFKDKRLEIDLVKSIF